MRGRWASGRPPFTTRVRAGAPLLLLQLLPQPRRLPRPRFLVADMSRYCIFMEHVQGRSVKDLLFSQALEGQALDSVLSQIGVAVATLHDGNLVHGDLTTSNILVRDSGAASLWANAASRRREASRHACHRSYTRASQIARWS